MSTSADHGAVVTRQGHWARIGVEEPLSMRGRHQLRAPRGAQLGQQVRDVPLDGAVADEQPGADLAVAEPVGDEPEHFCLARGEPVGVLRGRLDLQAGAPSEVLGARDQSGSAPIRRAVASADAQVLRGLVAVARCAQQLPREAAGARTPRGTDRRVASQAGATSCPGRGVDGSAPPRPCARRGPLGCQAPGAAARRAPARSSRARASSSRGGTARAWAVAAAASTGAMVGGVPHRVQPAQAVLRPPRRGRVVAQRDGRLQRGRRRAGRAGAGR